MDYNGAAFTSQFIKSIAKTAALSANAKKIEDIFLCGLPSGSTGEQAENPHSSLPNKSLSDLAIGDAGWIDEAHVIKDGSGNFWVFSSAPVFIVDKPKELTWVAVGNMPIGLCLVKETLKHSNITEKFVTDQYKRIDKVI